MQTVLPRKFSLLGLLLLSGCDDPRILLRRPPGPQLDMFYQAAVPKVDVLWVVDNSASMAEEQEALAQNFSSFFDYLDRTGADFHIGVISTDVYSENHRGQLQGSAPIISRATPETAKVFTANVKVGTLGKGDEQGFYAAELALTEPLVSTANTGFLRQDAYLFLIFVSDEDDHSFGEVGYYLRRFEQLKGIGNDGMVTIGAVVELEAGTCADADPGLRYRDLAERAHGLAVNLCAEHFGDSLDALGFEAAGLKRQFALTHPVKIGSLNVWIKTRCNQAPPPESACTDSFDDCAGENELYGRTCVVRMALPDGYAYEADTGSIRFYGQAVPPFGAIVEVGYTPDEETR